MRQKSHGPGRPGLSFLAALNAAVVVSLLTACAGLGKAPEERVSERAQTRWDLLLSDQLEAAYAYLSPGYRSGLSLRNYQRKLLTQDVRWTGAEVIESNCSSDTCKIRISIDYGVYGALPGVSKMQSRRDIEEDWVLVDREWYFLPGN